MTELLNFRTELIYVTYSNHILYICIICAQIYFNVSSRLYKMCFVKPIKKSCFSVVEFSVA